MYELVVLLLYSKTTHFDHELVYSMLLSYQNNAALGQSRNHFSSKTGSEAFLAWFVHKRV